jgi:hypothetical protein
MGTTTCSTCGSPLRAEATFCVRCGARSGDSGAPIGSSPASTPTAPGAAAAVAVTPVPTTPTTPIAVDADNRLERDRMRRVVLVGAFALVLTLVARLAASALSSTPASDGEIIARLPVGPDGGKATFDDGGKIKVPKGALAQKQTITVRRTVLTDRVRAISPFGGSIVVPAGAQTVYIFGPVDIEFLKAVTIVLPLPPPPAQGLVFVSVDGQISFISGTTGDGTVSVRVTSFRFDRPGTFV